MIRIIYRWRLKAKTDLESFQVAWVKATTAIRGKTPGARGSFLLQSLNDPAEILTIARWDRLDDWKSFWEDPNRSEMSEMHLYAERLSEEAYHEIEDHTV